MRDDHRHGEEGTAPEQHGYDIPYHWARPAFYQYVVQHAVDRIVPLIRDRVVLEAGCGDGYVTNLLAEHAKHVHGFDISERAIAFAELIVRRPNVGFHVARASDVARMAKEVGAIDVVVAYEVIEHLAPEERDRFLSGARGILRGGGILALTTPNGRRPFARTGHFHFDEYAATDLQRMIEGKGFSPVRVEGIYLRPFPDKLEHFAPIEPFRTVFRTLVRRGRDHPRWCRTLLCVATSPE